MILKLIGAIILIGCGVFAAFLFLQHIGCNWIFYTIAGAGIWLWGTGYIIEYFKSKNNDRNKRYWKEP